ncbi:Phage major capsid protein, HK97 family [Desulforapulum autotrophicum HRM2]|uniref:Phage major capsid protein, HK97 family n=1 Tax=Desulforapulum autotrophicum (strain ATCC 43914 / DSM 3382 / VKM B-1955 / HRM2) TaxID=177437 RepID=C0QHJ2_DESAH|nr:phage major capsid protein [Desulforapulum autotrophicum]ACN17851.1 Phage major capsid protein, HK97 family [Desulforapulum autotrophicum HRM2]
MNLEEMKAALAKKAQRLKDLVGQDRLSDKEKTEKRTLLSECQDLKTDIEQGAEERQLLDDLDKSYVTPPAGGQLGGQFSTRDHTRPTEDRSYRGMFAVGEPLSRDSWKDPDEFLNVLLSGRHDERLKRTRSEKRSMIEGVSEDGGFSVPTEFAAKWLDSSLPAEIVRTRAQVWPMKSSERVVPGWSGKDHSGGTLFGGFKMQWLGEAQTGTRQTGKMEVLTLKARKGAIFAQISNELKDDGMSFAQQLEFALKTSVGFGLDSNFINGDGVAKPAGVLTTANPALITVAKETSQTEGTIVYRNLSKMYARLAPGSYKNAVWLCNQDCMQSLLEIYVPIGETYGTHAPLLNESNGTFSIFGIPVIFTEHCASLGAQGDINLVDFTQYAVGLRKDLSLDISNAPGWTEDMTDYRLIVRVDGMSTWSAPVTPLNGTVTLSPFITLGARDE